MTIYVAPRAVAFGWNNPGKVGEVENAATLPLIITAHGSLVVDLLQAEYDGLHTGFYFLDARDLEVLRGFIESTLMTPDSQPVQTVEEAKGLRDILARFSFERGAPKFHLQANSRLIMVVLCHDWLRVPSVPLLTLRVLLGDFKQPSAREMSELGLDAVDLYRVTQQARGINSPVMDESIR